MELQSGAKIATHVEFLDTIYLYTGSESVNLKLIPSTPADEHIHVCMPSLIYWHMNISMPTINCFWVSS